MHATNRWFTMAAGMVTLMLIGLTAQGEWVATGGSVTNYSMNGTNYTAHIFTNNGPFAVNSNLSCDVLVVGDNVKFGIPEVKRGLAAAAGGLMRLPKQIPPRIAMEMALTGDFISAQRAYELGLINRIVPAGSALEGALEMAKTIAANGPMAVLASKRVVVESGNWSEEEMWKNQAAIVDPVFSSEDAIEGSKAFAEKREPVWNPDPDAKK